MKKLDLRLLRMIKNTKGQFIAITIVVIVGLTIYTAVSMGAVNLDNTVKHYYKITNFSDLYVQLVKIPDNAIEEITKIEGVKKAEGRLVFDVPLKTNDDEEKVNVRIISTKEKRDQINSLYLEKGNFIKNPNNEALVINQFASARNIKIDEFIKPQIMGRNYKLKVNGIVGSPEYVYLMEDEQTLLPDPEGFGVIFVSEEFAKQSFGYKGSYNEVLIKAKKGYDIDKLKNKLEEELERYGVKRIITKENQLSNKMVSEEVKGAKQSSKAIPIVFLGVAAIIIAVMISRMVKKDRTTIGVLKALGYGNKSLINHYMKYSLTIGLVGSVFGIILGSILSSYIAKMYIMFFNIPILKITFYYRYMILAVVISVIFCIIAGLWGTRRVLNIMPAESMRPEPPKTGNRILLDRFNVLWKKLSFSWKMVLRNIFRSKKRFIFITLGISLTFVVIFLPFSSQDSFNSIFVEHYGKFQRMDYNINFSKPLNNKVIKDIKQVTNVKDIEGKIEYPFEVVYGHRDKVCNIIGLENNTQFFNFKNLKDENIKLPKKGILLSEGLAKYIGVKKGEKVKIENFIPGKDDLYVRVEGIIKQSLGLNGYMNIDFMREKLLQKNLLTGVYLNSDGDIKKDLEDMKNITSVQSLSDMRSVFNEFLDLMIYSIGVMLLFGGVLGFAIVYNSTILGISERRLEFSSLRVMGFTKKEIFIMILKENIFMTILGILIGIPLGKYMIDYIEKVFSTEIYTLNIESSFKTYIVSVMATLIFVFLAQLATMKKIYKLDFIEALKNRIT